jgi:hypothetical protein
MTTPKRLNRPIRLIPHWMDVQAVMARLASVYWVNKNQFYRELNALIDQELAQLVKAPTVAPAPFSLSSGQLVCPFPNPGQVFKGYDLVIGFSFFNQLVADCMVLMRLKAFFLAGQPFQQFSATSARTARAFRCFLLEFGSQIAVMVTNFSCFLSAISIVLRGNANVCPAQIYAQNLICFLGLVGVRLKLNIQVITTVLSLCQCCRFGLLSFQQAKLVIANMKRESLSSIHQSQTNCPVLFSKTERPRVVSCASWSKASYGFSVLFSCLSVATNTPNSVNSQLCGQTKPSSNIVITKRLNSYFIS